jgi:hypothetical protein
MKSGPPREKHGTKAQQSELEHQPSALNRLDSLAITRAEQTMKENDTSSDEL